MEFKKVRSSADKTFCFWGRAKRGGRVRKMIVVLMVVGGISMAFLSHPIRCAAKTQQSLPEEEIPEDIQEYCEIIGKRYNICPEFLESIAYYESRFIPDAKNGNCWGLMQINVKVHSDRIKRIGFEKEELLDPYKNLIVAANLLEELFEEYEDAAVVLMLYAGQEEAISRYEKYGITTKYVQKVLTRSERYERQNGK